VQANRVDSLVIGSSTRLLQRGGSGFGVLVRTALHLLLDEGAHHAPRVLGLVEPRQRERPVCMPRPISTRAAVPARAAASATRT
jgi:hypothetical protein